MSEYVLLRRPDATGTIFRYRFVLSPALNDGKECGVLLELMRGLLNLEIIINILLSHFWSIWRFQRHASTFVTFYSDFIINQYNRSLIFQMWIFKRRRNVFCPNIYKYICRTWSSHRDAEVWLSRWSTMAQAEERWSTLKYDGLFAEMLWFCILYFFYIQHY